MPVYEYLCKACDHRFELRQKVADPIPASCPSCEEGPIQKVFSPVGIIFKGSGFYVNDYKKQGARADGESSSTAAEDKSDSKSDKAEAKSESKAEANDSTKTESAPAAPASPEPAKSAA